MKTNHLNSNVEVLKELEASGCTRIIIMCGDENRSDLFSDECHIDTKETLAESLFELISALQGTLLAPCDAYLADVELFSKIQGVPLTIKDKDSLCWQDLIVKMS